MLRNTAILQYPQAPFSQPQFHQPTALPPQQSMAPGGRGQPHNAQAQTPVVFRSNELHTTDAVANTLPQHPDTPASIALYAAQVIAWNNVFPGCLKANEHCPYPLTLGTATLCSNECFGCGHIGHWAPEY
jgi:hypothetical protein